MVRVKEMQTTPAWQTMDPRSRVMHEAQLKAYVKQLDDMIGQKLAMQTGLFCQSTLEHMMRFYNLVMVWLIKTASGFQGKVDFAQVARGNVMSLSLFPLPSPPPMQFSTLPEWIIEDICEFYIFVAK